jgi:hypothetical protein
MKKFKSIGSLVLSLALIISACEPQDKSDYSLGAQPTAEDLDFTITPQGNVNIVDFQNTSDMPGVAVWQFGDGSAEVKGDLVTAEYPIHGDYTVVMTLYTEGGSTSISKVVTISNDDMSLLNTPMYNALTGGADDADGKTWVFDQYHAGHFGVGPRAQTWPEWWQAGAEEKTQSSMYTQEFTFTQIGLKLNWVNNGSVYTNEPGRAALANLGFTNSVVPGAGDFDVQYPLAASYTFSLNEAEKTLTLSDGAFFGHYTGSSTYEIVTLTADELYVKVVSTVEPGNGWWYRFIPKEKNVKPPIVVKAVPLAEDFESETSKVAFAYEDMGALVSKSYSNPAPVPINQSGKVFLYQKTAGFWSNIFNVVSGYKFDLTTQNKVRLKVFLPSYNDYTTENGKAGDWVSDAKLQKKVAVKLQNNDLGGNAYTTQTEVSFTNLETDKWLDLTFDFSGVANRQDYNKIVIQIGGEGHTGQGIFFVDDFSFGE